MQGKIRFLERVRFYTEKVWSKLTTAIVNIGIAGNACPASFYTREHGPFKLSSNARQSQFGFQVLKQHVQRMQEKAIPVPCIDQF